MFFVDAWFDTVVIVDSFCAFTVCKKSELHIPKARRCIINDISK